MMYLKEEERVGENDKVLAVVTNQYMFEQLLWYHSKYPEGIWEAIVIKFSATNSLLDIMYQKCVECGFFSKIVCHNQRVLENSFLQKLLVMVRYVLQYIFRSKERNDKRLIEDLVGEGCAYKKIIVQSTCSIVSVASLNAMSEEILVCLEDGLGDYLPVRGITHWSELLDFLLAKMNVVNGVHGRRFRMKYDDRMIKYCSLPDKMQYRGFKEIRQLFEDDDREISFTEKELLLRREGYDLVIFSTAFLDYENKEDIYEILHNWLKRNYAGKKILFKPHPREVHRIYWDDLSVDVGGEEMSGEVLLDLLPDVEILFLDVSTILMKVCRENRKFKIILFDNIKSKWYERAFQFVFEILGLGEEDMIVLPEVKN